MSTTQDFFATAPAPSAQHLKITDEAEACAAVLFACRRADEIDGPGGTAAFMTTLKSRNIFIGSDPEALVDAATRYFEQAGSSAALIDAAIGAIREQTRLPLFYHCLDMMLADGVVTPQEHKIFLYLKGKFRVDDDAAFNALDVLVVKNQL
ncbi:MAG: TerB family tellurite resistance protein [Saprospiraceae bacterium]|nr:TerB family tellurite resistance protein [Saprospiraceae bacterium]